MLQIHWHKYNEYDTPRKISFTIVIWTFENNFEVNHKLGKYLQGSCWLVSDLNISFNYFLRIVLVRERSRK